MVTPIVVTGPTKIIGFGSTWSRLNCTCDVAISGGNVSDLEIRWVGFIGKVRQFVGTTGPGQNVRLISCSFNGATQAVAGQTTAAVFCNGINNVVIDDCDYGGNGLGPSGDTSCEIMFGTTPTSGHRISNNRFVGNGTTYGIGCNNVSDTEICNNRVNQGNCGVKNDGQNVTNNGYGILCYTTTDPDVRSERNNIHDNLVWNCAGTGIYFHGQTDGSVDDNTIWDVAKQQNTPELPVGGIGGVCDHCSFDGNTVNGVPVTGGGIVIAGVWNKITGTLTRNCPYAGIWLRPNCTSCLLDANLCDGPVNSRTFDEGTGNIRGTDNGN